MWLLFFHEHCGIGFGFYWTHIQMRPIKTKRNLIAIMYMIVRKQILLVKGGMHFMYQK